MFFEDYVFLIFVNSYFKSFDNENYFIRQRQGMFLELNLDTVGDTILLIFAVVDSILYMGHFKLVLLRQAGTCVFKGFFQIL